MGKIEENILKSCSEINFKVSSGFQIQKKTFNIHVHINIYIHFTLLRIDSYISVSVSLPITLSPLVVVNTY